MDDEYDASDADGAIDADNASEEDDIDCAGEEPAPAGVSMTNIAGSVPEVGYVVKTVRLVTVGPP